jgi:hypothetical protein
MAVYNYTTHECVIIPDRTERIDAAKTPKSPPALDLIFSAAFTGTLTRLDKLALRSAFGDVLRSLGEPTLLPILMVECCTVRTMDWYCQILTSATQVCDAIYTFPFYGLVSDQQSLY